MNIVIMGVAGSGKTTIGTLLADALVCEYLEGDSLHPAGNIDAMTRGIPLTDDDRAPWLAAIRARVVEAVEDERSLVIGCSALKESYRRSLAGGLSITWVYLKGSEDLIRSRVQNRNGHFFDAGMLDSQFATLEEPRDALVIDVSQPPEEIVEQILTSVWRKPIVRVSADLDELSVRAAEAVAATIPPIVEANGRCSLVLSGGDTPIGLHRILGSRFRHVLPWSDIHVFWSDERYVPHDHELSNYRMARETLLDHVPCPPENVHPMPTGFADPAEAAREYEATLKRYFAGERPKLDLAILGLGPDGHTASLFPGAPALQERTRWALAVTADAEPPSRLTLTLPVLVASAHSWFLVAGSNKAAAVRDTLAPAANARRCPAAYVQRANGSVMWWLDRAAAAEMEAPGPAS